MKASIYTRISKDAEGLGAGIARQEADCRELAEQRGDTIVAVHADNDVSAYSGRRRPAYEALLQQITAGDIEAVYVWHTDRLYRRATDLERYIDACQPRGVPTFAVQSGPLDLATPSGRMIARTLGAVAAYEVEQKSLRQRRANLQRVEQGQMRPGGLCFGYRIGTSREIIPEEATVAREVAAYFASGGTLARGAQMFNERGFKTRRNNEWTPRSLHIFLRSPGIAGYVVHQGRIVRDAAGEPVSGSWEPIIEPELWWAIQGIFERRPRPPRNGQFLLSSVAQCATCGATVHSGGTSASSRHAKRYACSANRSHLSRLADPVDRFVQDVILERLSRPDARAALAAVPDDDGMTRRNLSALYRRQEELATAYGDGLVTLAQLQAGTARIRAQIEPLEQQLAPSSAAVAKVLDAHDVAAAWLEMDVAQRREMIRSLVTIRLSAAGRATYYGNSRVPRPEFIEITWR